MNLINIQHLMLNNLIQDQVKLSLSKNEKWMGKNGYSGYDPHDIKGLPIFIYFLKPGHGIPMKILRKPFFWAIDFFPKLMRKIFFVPKTVNAKGMALFAKANLNLYIVTNENIYKERALECLNWLLNNSSKGYKNNAWGYPFDWQSGVFTPAGTPACVVCSAVCDAFWLAWQVLKDPKYLDVCVGIGNFFMEDLNIDIINENCVCFSYTPLDHLHVHNANLMVADILIRIGKATDNKKFIETGLKASNYALEEQQSDGSIFYWGNDQQFHSPGSIDHYHTGFEIRSLYSIWSNTGIESYKISYERYYDFYLKNFLYEKDDILLPKMTPKNLYPVNIHSCAEAIILNSTLLSIRKEPSEFIDKLTKSIIEHMQEPDGSFIYVRRKLGILHIKDNSPYIRWGQAWMNLALSEYLLHKKENKN
jgi:hypothetical protein